MYQQAKMCILVVIFAFFTSLGTCEIAAGKIIYIDEIAAGANDGSSWEDAYNFLQDALELSGYAPKDRRLLKNSIFFQACRKDMKDCSKKPKFELHCPCQVAILFTWQENNGLMLLNQRDCPERGDGSC